MTVNTVAAATVIGAGTTTPKVHKTALDSSDFMNLVMQQLKNQNPLDPMSDKDYMSQLSQMDSLQELQKMNTTLSKLTSANSMSQAANLIGRNVEANLADGTAVSGLVSSVSMVNDNVVLTVGNYLVPLTGVTTVSAPATSGTATHG
jgi:flagellar basal-body rod modification protein FlgD